MLEPSSIGALALNLVIIIGGESYFLREHGYLMPMGKDERPPELRKFAPSAK